MTPHIILNIIVLDLLCVRRYIVFEHIKEHFERPKSERKEGYCRFSCWSVKILVCTKSNIFKIGSSHTRLLRDSGIQNDLGRHVEEKIIVPMKKRLCAWNMFIFYGIGFGFG